MTARTIFPRLTQTLRQAVDEWLARGYAVEVRADGSIRVEPKAAVDADPFDLVNMKR